jgi:hypothetical protein
MCGQASEVRQIETGEERVSLVYLLWSGPHAPSAQAEGLRRALFRLQILHAPRRFAELQANDTNGVAIKIKQAA